jgi:hypothetical protein
MPLICFADRSLYFCNFTPKRCKAIFSPQQWQGCFCFAMSTSKMPAVLMSTSKLPSSKCQAGSGLNTAGFILRASGGQCVIIYLVYSDPGSGPWAYPKPRPGRAQAFGLFSKSPRFCPDPALVMHGNNSG